jgi:hypothetical protein
LHASHQQHRAAHGTPLWFDATARLLLATRQELSLSHDPRRHVLLALLSRHHLLSFTAPNPQSTPQSSLQPPELVPLRWQRRKQPLLPAGSKSIAATSVNSGCGPRAPAKKAVCKPAPNRQRRSVRHYSTQKIFALRTQGPPRRGFVPASSAGVDDLAYWAAADGKNARILVGVVNYLYALDAATGKPISVRHAGRIDLRENLGREPASEIPSCSTVLAWYLKI